MTDGLAVRVAVREYGWNCCRRFAPYVLVSTGLFLSTMIVGLAVGIENAGETVPIATIAPEYYADLSTGGLFVHNGTVALQSILSIVFLGVPAIFIVALNGFVVGAGLAAGVGDIGVLWSIVLLLPHGTFELPAIWLSGAIAFRWLHEGWKAANARGVSVPHVVLDSVIGVGAVYLLLAVAAVVEAHLTHAIYVALTG
jgi:stage II sporulation protein M